MDEIRNLAGKTIELQRPNLLKQTRLNTSLDLVVESRKRMELRWNKSREVARVFHSFAFQQCLWVTHD